MNRQAKPAAFWKTRPLAALAAAWGLGARLGLEALLPRWGWIAFSALLILLLVCFFVLKSRCFACVAMAVALGGCLWGSICAHPQRPAEGSYAVSAVIDGEVRLREDGQVSCYVKEVTLDGRRAGRAYWSFYRKKGETISLDDGDRVIFTGRVYHPGERENPYGFDFEEMLLTRGIVIGLYGREGLLAQPCIPLNAYRLRSCLAAALERRMPGESGLARALLLGDRAGLGEDDRAAFRALGVAHVLAVSGLHVGFIYAFAMGLLRPLSLRWKSLLAGVLLLAYGWLTGFSPATVRALTFCLMALAARMLWRGPDPLTCLGAAFLLLTAANPMNLVSPGFILSFTAVLGIVLLAESIERRLGFLPRWLRRSLAVSLAAQGGVAVPVMACYQQLPLLSLGLNLLVIPATGVLMGLYLAVLLLSATPLGPLAGQGAAWLTRLYLGGLGAMAELPFASVNTGMPGWAVWLGALIVLVSLSPYVLLRGRRRAAAAALGLALCFFTWPPQSLPPTYLQFSLGQADGAAVMLGAHTAVIDTGEQGGDMAAYLKAMNRRIDALFLTHLHLDHAGGLAQLMASGVEIGACYISRGAYRADVNQQALSLLEALEGMGVPLIELSAGDQLAVGGIGFRVLAPAQAAAPGQEANSTSLCLAISLGGATVLTTGDMPGKLEGEAALPADVLKVAHHGAARSTGADFLSAVKPRIALIPCGAGGSLPNAKTLLRLEAAGAQVYRTDETGAVTLTWGPQGLQVETFLK